VRVPISIIFDRLDDSDSVIDMQKNDGGCNELHSYEPRVIEGISLNRSFL
jgi:hypothetical protein